MSYTTTALLVKTAGKNGLQARGDILAVSGEGTEGETNRSMHMPQECQSPPLAKSGKTSTGVNIVDKKT